MPNGAYTGKRPVIMAKKKAEKPEEAPKSESAPKPKKKAPPKRRTPAEARAVQQEGRARAKAARLQKREDSRVLPSRRIPKE